MKISVKRSGGYAGVTETFASVDTKSLGAETAEQVEKMVQGLEFFNIPEVYPKSAVGADLFKYEITISENDRQHTVIFADDGGPDTEPLRKLVNALKSVG